MQQSIFFAAYVDDSVVQLGDGAKLKIISI